jgi:GT2 family glycosyltransferase
VPALAIIILTYNRRDDLIATVSRLRAQSPASDRTIRLYIVDNASTDKTREWLETNAGAIPPFRAILMPNNSGVQGFNAGVAAAISDGLTPTDYLLILDDDAWPSRRGQYVVPPTESALRLTETFDRNPSTTDDIRTNALDRAIELLDSRPELAAVTLMPVHPKTGISEWPHLDLARDDWPFMGCANLVRSSDWQAAGGYEQDFFLYRNDTDLAMKLLAMGRGVHADPNIFAYHDSPAAARKSERWLELATRNWCWLARRHGRGWTKWKGICLGCGWAIVQAGVSPKRLYKSLRGILTGLFAAPPRLPTGVRPDGVAFAAAIDSQLRGRSERGKKAASRMG